MIHVKWRISFGNRITKNKTPEVALGGFEKAGDDLLSRYSHYHGPQVLNGRVRNGNGCGHLGMVTGRLHKDEERRAKDKKNAHARGPWYSKWQG